MDHHSQIQACFRSDLSSEVLPPDFSQDYFKHSWLSRTLLLLPMLLRSSLLSLCQRNANLCKASTSKTPLHIEASSALYFGQCLFLGRAQLLFQSAHFVTESNSFGFSLFLHGCGEVITPEPQDHTVCSLYKYPQLHGCLADCMRRPRRFCIQPQWERANQLHNYIHVFLLQNCPEFFYLCARDSVIAQKDKYTLQNKIHVLRVSLWL